MALINRVLPIMVKGFRRQLQTAASTSSAASTCSAASAAADALAVQLLREPESAIKATLDSEENSALPDGRECFWEPLVVRLGYFSSRKAMLVLEWKLEKLLKEDIQTHDPYCKLIQYSANLNSISFAMRVFTSIESHGIIPNTSIFNALVSASLSAGNLATALSLFEIMQWSEYAKPDLETYNSFISMYSKLRDDRCMKGWYLALKQSGLLINIQTYELLIAGFIRLGNFKDASQLFKETLSSKTSPNPQIFNSMLEELCMQKDSERVKDLVEYMIKEGLKLSKFSVKSLIHLHFEQGRTEELVDFLGLLRGDELGVEPGIHGCVIRAYALLDMLEDMENWIGRMLNEGMMFACKEDVEAVVSSYFRQKDFERLDLFLDRIKSSYKLGKSTYDILVGGYRKFQLYDRLDSVIKEMKGSGCAC